LFCVNRACALPPDSTRLREAAAALDDIASLCATVSLGSRDQHNEVLDEPRSRKERRRSAFVVVGSADGGAAKEGPDAKR